MRFLKCKLGGPQISALFRSIDQRSLERKSCGEDGGESQCIGLLPRRQKLFRISACAMVEFCSKHKRGGQEKSTEFIDSLFVFCFDMSHN